MPDTLEFFVKHARSASKSFNNCTTNCYVSVPDTFYAKRTPDDFNTFPDLFSVIYQGQGSAFIQSSVNVFMNFE